MPAPYTPVRALLDEMIQMLGDPTLSTEQGRADYRALLLTKTARALLDLPDLGATDAVVLYALIHERLRSLTDLELLREEQVEDLRVELTALYAKFRPELLEQLPRPMTPEEREGFPRA